MKRQRGERGRRRSIRRAALLATCAMAAAGVVAGTLASFKSDDGAAKAADVRPEPGKSSESVAEAASALGFHPTEEPGVGVMEALPATTMMPPASPSLLRVGKEAPDFQLTTPTGKSVRLRDYRGKTVLLEFFATWCPHCQAEARHLVRLSAGLPASRFVFVSVNADSEDAASVYAFDRYFGVPYTTLLDPSGRHGSFSAAGDFGLVARSFGVSLYPTFYIIDPMGRIAWRGDREQPDALLLERLKDASGA